MYSPSDGQQKRVIWSSESLLFFGYLSPAAAAAAAAHPVDPYGNDRHRPPKKKKNFSRRN